MYEQNKIWEISIMVLINVFLQYFDLGFLVRDYESFGKFILHILFLLHVEGIRRNLRETTDSTHTYMINNLEKLTEYTTSKGPIWITKVFQRLTCSFPPKI